MSSSVTDGSGCEPMNRDMRSAHRPPEVRVSRWATRCGPSHQGPECPLGSEVKAKELINR